MKKLFLFSLLVLTGCGTIFGGGTSQDISFDSNVTGTEIFISGVKVCKTPCVYPIDKGSGSIVVTAKKKGYEEQNQILKPSFNNFAILNLTGWPSWLVDIATGGMWQYRRDGVYIDMEKSARTHAEIQNIKKDVATRRFVLLNYSNLKSEASISYSGEYITALAGLSGKKEQELINIINTNHCNEVALAHILTGIKQ